MSATALSFLALIFSLPARNATERMRAWRALKSMGGAVLRDGVYLLPRGAEREQSLLQVAEAIQTAAGMAEVVEIRPRSELQTEAFRALFDRRSDYRSLLEEITRIDPEGPDVTLLKRNVRTLRRRLQELTAIDFFPDNSRNPLQEALNTLEARLIQRLDPDEPLFQEGAIPRRDPQAFQGRLWISRARPWVDRLASAWLIQRFIDPAARFLWLAPDQPLPPEAVGFDFDGAIFSHVQQKVTFETLLAAFDLEEDPALMQLGRLVHTLDAGGVCPEAAGCAALLHGMRLRLPDDHALMTASRPIFDDYYLHFSSKDQSDG
ncbi:MAG: chromate resistance protein [Magnetococcales bacterium]|nr:chromate resistance protein [Magnetococcales bacterium]